MASLADIRARLAQQEQKKNNQSSKAQTDNSVYPHWNADEGTTATVRFLPDGDANNTFFWVEKQMIKLPFNGIKGDHNVKQVIVQVPCVEMFGDSCPILAEVRPWYKDDTLKEMANKYWKKRTYLYQGFVRQNPMGDDVTPTNPIRRFIISPQIFTIIKSSLMDPEIQEMPTDYVRGLDFNIKKTSKGGYADYSTSNWARRESPLTEAELAAVEAHGLFNLSEFLPKKPNESELAIIKEMFEASVDGRPYDNDRWGNYYRPYGLENPNNGNTNNSTFVPQVATKNTTSSNDDGLPFEPQATTAPVNKTVSTDKAQDILNMIKNRKKS
jgi:hypothetical protein